MSEHVGHHKAPPTIHEVIVSALAQALPCATCGSIVACRCIKAPGEVRVADRATLVENVLREFGHLPPLAAPAGPPTTAEIHETARWLAGQSQHPRYVGDGWQKIMQSIPDVEMAFTQASRTASNADLEALGAARRLLAAHHATHGPEAPRA